MKVKICGIQDCLTALAAYEYGADALGFVFAPSKRRITIEQGREIARNIPSSIIKVGIFVNEEIKTVQHICETCGLDVVQLHGDEDEVYVQRLNLPVMKAFSISTEKDVKKAMSFSSDYILLDSPRETYYGGNGNAFNWKMVKGNSQKKKLVLAGGLNINNVKQAIEIVQPYMVDVSSGVETDGKKDIEKIQAFLKSAKDVRV